MDVIKEMEPSAMREVFVEIPDVKWNDVGRFGLYKTGVYGGCGMATK